MSLALGTQIGPYEIVSAIGSGGMGEVYKARDARLKRDVALKVLPDTFSTDPERLARFEREAEVLAALNHPHIAAIYGLEAAGGLNALVMELVHGEDLAARIARGPIPLEEALSIAKQIADALDTAHQRGIIHRDLKPANIKVRPDGTVKVLDFGLAKTVDAATSGVSSQSPTLTSPAMTAQGVILGTAAYMAPEQAKGQEVDKRTDIWAFGCVLYEMLTSKRAFDGEDVTEVMGAVVRLEPNWSALPSEVPPPIRSLLESCLVKERRERVADISTARFVLDKVGSLTAPAHTVGSGTLGVTRAGAHRVDDPRAHWRRVRLAGVVGAVAIGGGLLGWSADSLLTPHPSAPHVVRFAMTLPPGEQFFDNPADHQQVVALSPDSAHLAYVANQRLMLRAMDQLEATPIRGSEAGRSPFFSPDGQTMHGLSCSRWRVGSGRCWSRAAAGRYVSSAPGLHPRRNTVCCPVRCRAARSQGPLGPASGGRRGLGTRGHRTLQPLHRRDAGVRAPNRG
jgi:eukaryotic-like serine/threonine-protein kinase